MGTQWCIRIYQSMKNGFSLMKLWRRPAHCARDQRGPWALALAVALLGAGSTYAAYTDIDPRITNQLQNTTAYVGYDASFSVLALSSATLQYQWRTNGVPVTGVVATNATCTLSNLTLSANGTRVSVIVTNAVGWLTSSTVTLTVLPTLAPVIVAQPTNTTGYSGYTTTFTVTASNAPLAYQWYTNGIKITSATSASYTTPRLTSAFNGLSYSVIVSNSQGMATSTVAVLTVMTALAPAITTQPADQIVVAGTKATFTVAASGAPLLYQWRTNGANVSRANAAAYTTGNAVLRDNGVKYSVIVSNSAGSVTSAVAKLSVLGAFRIAFRPVTPVDVAQYGLPSTTQRSPGGPNVGLGEPAYLEALITKGASNYFGSVTWTLSHWANGSAGPSVLKASPLTANVPCADYGDTLAYDIAGRRMLVPDAVGTNNNGDYVVVATLTWTNSVLPAPGVVVTATQTVYGSLYKGKDTCYLCHPDKASKFESTAHATDLHNLKTIPAALKPLTNVQCENCHGAGWRHIMSSGNTNMITISLSANNCGQCHTNQVAEWGQTWHARGKAGASAGGGSFRSGNTLNSCGQCHSTKGFLDVNDPGISYSNAVVTTRGTYNEGVTCEACHDPHSMGMGTHQLRNIPSYTLMNGYVVTNAGDGMICVSCHHERNSATNVVSITIPTSRGAHHSTQADLLFGQNAYEFGLKMPSPSPHAQVPDTCVGCHMPDTPAGLVSDKVGHVGGHTFTLAWMDPTDGTVPPGRGSAPFLTERCAPCHGTVTNFTFGGQIFTTNLVSCQEEVSNLLYQVAKLLDPTNTGLRINTALITNAVTRAGLAQRAAYFNWTYFSEDASLGVHNPNYTKSVLRATIAALGGTTPSPYGSGLVPAGMSSPSSASGAAGSSGSGGGGDAASGAAGSSSMADGASGRSGTRQPAVGG